MLNEWKGVVGWAPNKPNSYRKLCQEKKAEANPRRKRKRRTSGINDMTGLERNESEGGTGEERQDHSSIPFLARFQSERFSLVHCWKEFNPDRDAMME